MSYLNGHEFLRHFTWYVLTVSERDAKLLSFAEFTGIQSFHVYDTAWFTSCCCWKAAVL